MSALRHSDQTSGKWWLEIIEDVTYRNLSGAQSFCIPLFSAFYWFIYLLIFNAVLKNVSLIRRGSALWWEETERGPLESHDGPQVAGRHDLKSRRQHRWMTPGGNCAVLALTSWATEFPFKDFEINIIFWFAECRALENRTHKGCLPVSDVLFGRHRLAMVVVSTWERADLWLLYNLAATVSPGHLHVYCVRVTAVFLLQYTVRFPLNTYIAEKQ